MKFNKNPFKKKKEQNAGDKEQQKSSPSSPIVNQTQNRTDEKQNKDHSNNGGDKRITVICPEKKERVFSASNVLTFLAVIISAISLYLAFQSNEEVAKQFETANKPFLQAKEFKLYFINENRKIRYEPTLTNYGNHPVKTIKYRIAVLYDTIEINNYKRVDFAKPKNYEFIEVYCMKEKPEAFPLSTETKLPPIVYESAWKGLYNIYVWGEIIYENLVTGKQRRYEFVVRLKKYQTQMEEEAILYNKNEDVK